MSKLSQLLSEVAPTVASIVGGPFAVIAVKSIGAALGISEPTTEKIGAALESGLTPDQLVAVKQADADLQMKLAELGVETFRLEVSDHAGARHMQEETRSWTPPILATVITVGFLFIIVGLLTGSLKLWESSGLTILLGGLAGSFSSVVGYYFGASHSNNKPK